MGAWTRVEIMEKRNYFGFLWAKSGERFLGLTPHPHTWKLTGICPGIFEHQELLEAGGSRELQLLKKLGRKLSCANAFQNPVVPGRRLLIMDKKEGQLSGRNQPSLEQEYLEVVA